MSFELPGRSEFSQLMANHIFGDEDGDMLVTVVDGEGVANKFRRDGARSRPSLDDLFLVAHGDDFF